MKARPQTAAGLFVATLVFGFFAAFAGANAQVADVLFEIEARGVTGEEQLRVEVNNTVIDTIVAGTTTATYDVLVPGNTTWADLKLIYIDGTASNGNGKDIDLFSFTLDGDQRVLVAGDVQVSGQFVNGVGCTPLGDPINSNRIYCNGIVVFPFTPPATTTTTVPASSTTTTIPASGALVVINEIHYKGTGSDGDFVELHNPGNAAIDLTGYTFDDSGSAAASETVTLSGSIPSGGYVFISKDDFDEVAAYGASAIAQMPFGLSSSGETLTLREPGGAIADQVAYTNSSPWPTAPDGGGSSLELIDPLLDNALASSWLASTGVPTPSATNSVVGAAPSSAVTNVIATPFEPAVDQDITVVATAPVGSGNPTLYYVVDFGPEIPLSMNDSGTGADATAGDGVFTAWIPGQAAGELVRYRIESGGQLHPSGDGRNYEGVVVDDPSEIPTGLVNFEWFIPPSDYNAMFNDPTQEVSVAGSVLAIDGVVYDNMETNIRGGSHARNNHDKQGLSFDFASGVDVLNTDLVPYEIDEFALIAERGWTFGRPFSGWETYYAAGFPTVNAEHVRVQRNGQFYGIFRFSEKLDGAWRDAAEIDGGFYKAVPPGFTSSGLGFEKKQPDNDNQPVIDLNAELSASTSSAKTDFIYEDIDVSNAVNFLAATTIVGHFDSKVQNFYIHEDTEATGRWQIYPWDLSNAYGINGPDCSGDELNLSCVDSKLFDSLLAVPEIEEMMWRRVRTLLDGPIANGQIESAAAAYMAQVSSAEASADNAAWNSVIGYTSAGFINNEIDSRRNGLLGLNDMPSSQTAVPGIVITELTHSPTNGVEFLELHNPTSQSVDLSEWTVDAVGLTVPGGTVMLPGDYLILTSSVVDFQATYPNIPNTVLVEFSGGLSGGGEEVELLNAAGAQVDIVDYLTAAPWPTEPNAGSVSLSLFESQADNSIASSWGISIATGGTPGAANDTISSTPPVIPNVVINEIHYNPETTDEEFIELFNAESTTVDISGWDLDGLIVFPTGTTIAPGGYFVVTQALADFQAVYPGVAAIQWATGGLSNGGEGINLETAGGVLVDEVGYDDAAPWPAAPDGNGPSLELIDSAFNNDLAASWKASAANGGSPGSPNNLATTSFCNGLPVTVDIGNGDVPTVGDDVIVGTAGPDVIVALGGNDTICALDGDDIINAGPGGDFVAAGSGNDQVFGLAGNDTIIGNAGDDTIIGNAGDDTIIGSGGDDTLNGGLGGDTIFGGADDDTIFGQAGDDTVDGGADDDFILGAGGIDLINGGSGNDIINGGANDDTLSGGQDNDTIFGLTGNDIINGDAGDDTLFGQLGNDTINGGDGDDELLGNNGNDILTDPSGTNTLNGGAGNDTLTGGTGTDQLFGDANPSQAGNDTLTGNGGSDLLIGFAGNDTINSQDGGIPDTVNGGPHTTSDTCTTDAVDTVFNCE